MKTNCASLLTLSILTLVIITAKAQETKPAPVPTPPPPVEKTAEGCVIERFTIPSPSMNRQIQTVVVLPPEYSEKPNKHYPVLYALHPVGGADDMWAVMPKLRTELVTHPMIVVSFNADHSSYYIDSPIKPDSQFTTFFFKELMPYIESHYRVIAGAGGRAVTGASMGGYGAFHYMLQKPDAFSSISGVSAAAAHLTGDPSSAGYLKYLKVTTFLDLLGNPENQSAYQANDLFSGISAAAANKITFPPIYLQCGTEDFVKPHDIELRDFLTSKGYSCEYSEAPGAHHDWKYWKEACVGVMEFHWKHFTLPSE
jgi:S-formylglutathione hydrolase FrmB